jgi:hypothetical protein
VPIRDRDYWEGFGPIGSIQSRSEGPHGAGTQDSSDIILTTLRTSNLNLLAV